MSKKKSAAAAAEPEPRYVVLARRYRPAQFEEVIGQQHVTQTLQNAIRAQRVHHAYLFTGSRGVGKTTVARILAKALNCDEGPAPTPCDRCTSCAEIREGRSVDVYEIDGASHTGVDDVRELRANVRFMPARCRHKIYIIDEVHMLSTSAFNALLKTLEEPPAHVVFIFATTEPHKIPATILSRCQRFDFKRVPDATLVEHLQTLCAKEGVAVEAAGLALIARASEGSVRDALSLLDQLIAYATGEQQITSARVAEVLGVTDRRVLFALSRAILDRDVQGALARVDEIFRGGQDLSQVARAFLEHLRDLTVVRTCADPSQLIQATNAEWEELREQAAREEAGLVPQHFDRFVKAAEEIARSPSPRLVLEMALIEMAHAEPLLPLGDLLQRLEQMELRLSGSGPAPGGSGGGATFQVPPGVAGGRGRPRGGGPRTAAPGEELAGPGLAPAAPPPPSPAPAPSPAAGPAPQAPREAIPVQERIAVPRAAGEAMTAWQALLRQVEQAQPVVASPYFSGKLLDWSGGQIRLGYPPEAFELDLAREPVGLRAFAAECARHLSAPVTVQVVTLDAVTDAQPRALSAMEDRELQRQKRVRLLQDEARRHPLILAAQQELEATIEHIKTEADEP